MKLDALTGLRFFAAAMIVLHHLHGKLWIPKGVFDNFALAGGVSFFFCLSGFILHFSYRNKIHEISYGRFMAMRFFRLWPAHLTCLALAFFFVWHWLSISVPRSLDVGELLQVVFLMQSWTPDSTIYFAINGPSWSISTELAFYATFPFLCVWSQSRPITVLLTTTAVVALYLGLAQHFSHLLFDPKTPGLLYGLVGVSPFARILEFAVGVVLCEFVVFRNEPSRQSSGLIIGSVVEIAALILVVASLWAVPTFVPALTKDFGAVISTYFKIVLTAPAFCALIVVVSQQNGILSRFLSLPWLVLLGEISFAMYLVHQPVIYFFSKHAVSMEMWQQIPLFIGIVLGTSALIYYQIEKPGIRMSKFLFQRKPKKPDLAQT